MKIEIIEEKENPLLNRKELKIKVLHDNATPSRQEVRKMLVALLGVDKDTVILDSYKSRYGIKESYGSARIYNTKERALEVESKHLLEKNQLLATAQPSPAAASEPEEKPEAEAKAPTKAPKEEKKEARETKEK